MRIGILGGGQLARMLALAGYPLGFQFTVLDPSGEACARPLSDFLLADYGDPGALDSLATQTDLVTYEFENVPAEAVTRLDAHTHVFPPPRALATARDRLPEKRLFRQLGIETAPFAPVATEEELATAVAEVGLPAILKTRTLGYDGKGQVVLRPGDDPREAWSRIGRVPAILEGLVEFEREVSLVCVRGRRGESRFYPLSENRHREGILRFSRSLHEDPLQPLAEDYARRLLERLDYVGVLAIEFFQRQERLLANEMAPRVHNSGHWTIEGAVTSQFENHLRAVAGMPLGDTSARGHAAMINLIGEIPRRDALLAVPGLHLHLYGKSPRPGRKLGHLTLVEEDPRQLKERLQRLARVVPGLEEDLP